MLNGVGGTEDRTQRASGIAARCPTACVRGLGLSPGIARAIHEERLWQLVREGDLSYAHQVGRYATRRRRAILVATIVDLEARLTDAVLHMADKLIGGLFAKARNATRHQYAASAGDVARLMRLFHGTIEALATPRQRTATPLIASLRPRPSAHPIRTDT
jgi:hypothetical protein